jgi:hypothetical protein
MVAGGSNQSSKIYSDQFSNESVSVMGSCTDSDQYRPLSVFVIVVIVVLSKKHPSSRVSERVLSWQDSY